MNIFILLETFHRQQLVTSVIALELENAFIMN